MKHLGEYLDIHCGGVDNIFPHHTNEIAQTESCTGHKWCRYWFHVNHLVNQSGKMSKSENNFLTVSTLEEKGYDPLSYRMFCLQKLVKRVSQLQREGELQQEKFDFFKDKFIEALSDDLNTSNAVSLVYDVLGSDANDRTKFELIKSFDDVLSLNLTVEKQSGISSELEQHIKEMIDRRSDAKKRKDFAVADQIREALLKEGIALEDTREGTKWKLL